MFKKRDEKAVLNDIRTMHTCTYLEITKKLMLKNIVPSNNYDNGNTYTAHISFCLSIYTM